MHDSNPSRSGAMPSVQLDNGKGSGESTIRRHPADGFSDLSAEHRATIQSIEAEQPHASKLSRTPMIATRLRLASMFLYLAAGYVSIAEPVPSPANPALGHWMASNLGAWQESGEIFSPAGMPGDSRHHRRQSPPSPSRGSA